MKLTTGIVALALATGSAWAQNPNVINSTKTALQGAAQKKATDINVVLNGPAPAKPAAATTGNTAAKPAPSPKPKSSSGNLKASASPAPAKPVKAETTTKVATEKKDPMKPVGAVASKTAEQPGAAPEVAKSSSEDDKKYSMTGKRDPFISPVVNRQGGSGCSTGKKCLDIEQIAVRGVVKSDNGMIAVVTNGLNKAYFLRENDPVFNGYVVKITGDSVVFKETFQDRLGTP